ncbi:glycosyltransferase family 2 protein [Agromyces humatus]|uniref:Glycosyltransferase 2-like domain-containing protein n=1 Tax=Agromyces humatus TaxID=279573 RepID=A0ABN2K6W4_9MICO|nr:glycosyltransferase family 2 protein [Agromyces humatus]
MSAASESVLLSVVIPTHNVHPWIRETLGSVLAQDIADMEVIVVDDHSTDDTVEVVRHIARADDRVHIIEATRRGGGSARNTGVAQARGRYLIFCDGDDIVPDGAYRALVDSLEASGSDIAFGDYLKFSPNQTWRPTANWPAYAVARQAFTAAEEPSLLYGRACWNKAFRRSFWTAIGVQFPDVPRSNDIVPMTTAYLRANSIDMVDHVVYLYRERQGATSMSAKADSAASFLSYLDQEVQCAELVASADSPALSAAYASLIYDRDGWVHLAQYLRSEAREGDDDDAVRAALDRLLQATRRGIDRSLAAQKRIVFELTLAGETDDAAALARAVTGYRPDIGVELADWYRFLRMRSEAGESVLRDEPWLVRLLAETLATGILNGSEESDPIVAEVAAYAAGHEPGVLDDAPEFHVAPAASTLVTDFSASRAIRGRIVALASGRRLEIAVDTPHAGSATVVLLEPRTGAIVRPDAQSSTGRVVSARFAPRSLPPGSRVIVALQDASSDGMHVVRFFTDVPAYSRFDRFELVRRRDTLELRRRGHWLTRAGGKGLRLVRRRLRRPASTKP